MKNTLIIYHFKKKSFLLTTTGAGLILATGIAVACLGINVLAPGGRGRTPISNKIKHLKRKKRNGIMCSFLKE